MTSHNMIPPNDRFRPYPISADEAHEVGNDTCPVPGCGGPWLGELRYEHGEQCRFAALEEEREQEDREWNVKNGEDLYVRNAENFERELANFVNTPLEAAPYTGNGPSSVSKPPHIAYKRDGEIITRVTYDGFSLETLCTKRQIDDARGITG
jgi:hypothetical protein